MQNRRLRIGVSAAERSKATSELDKYDDLVSKIEHIVRTHCPYILVYAYAASDLLSHLGTELSQHKKYSRETYYKNIKLSVDLHNAKTVASVKRGRLDGFLGRFCLKVHLAIITNGSKHLLMLTD